MADKIDPMANGGKTVNLLPKYFQSDANKKFLSATIDQLIKPGTIKKINGYIGRKNAKSAKSDDIFVKAADENRQNYQLEPSLVVKDTLGNTTFFKDYQDYINQISVFGGNVTKHPRINSQEYYSWDPHIDWDKFVNFQNYYWLPYGPDTIKISGAQLSTTSTYTVQIDSSSGDNTYLFSPDGLTRNPSIQLYRGNTYVFEIDSPNNPFTIKTKRTTNPLDVYTNDLLDKNSIETGKITFTVPVDCPDVLFYVSSSDLNLGGVIEILAADENTAILDIEKELIGKKTYMLPDGTELSNGMKIQFNNRIVPEFYSNKEFYVEGVGDRIRLVNSLDLELISSFSARKLAPFDEQLFDSLPFEDASSYAGNVDYITINRASSDKNPWSRYNRWFHKDVILKSSGINGNIPVLDQSARAVRPIIEFEPDLQLFNFGNKSIIDIDLIDDFTTDVFSTLEGKLGCFVDGVKVADGQRILFTADTDNLVKNKIYRAEFLILNGQRQLHLVEESVPEQDQVVLVREGNKNKGVFYWYNGVSWKLAQQKTKLNQPPLFDVVDSDGNSYSDLDHYDGSTFRGTRLFGYKISDQGIVDDQLGFALSYRNIDNSGDILFSFDLATDIFEYKVDSLLVRPTIDVGYLIKNVPTGKIYKNGWTLCNARSVQAAIRTYSDKNILNEFDIDIFDDPTDLEDLVVKIYKNGIRVDDRYWEIVDARPFKKIVLKTDVFEYSADDILTIRAFSSQPINSNGYYEIPVNLQNNPLNETTNNFTLGEVIDHVNSIVDNLDEFVGEFPGSGNLRDLGNISRYGTKFVQHSGPMSLAIYHLTSENNNVIRALEKARDDYNKFKKNFITVSESLGVDVDTIEHVNLIMQALTKDAPKSSSYYFSDMVPFSAFVKNDFEVIDFRTKTYPLSSIFNLSTLSNRSVIVYVNQEQLLYGKDYKFNSEGFVYIEKTLVDGDAISIYEFENTNGCCVPPTPTKLGLWPKYEPMVFEDTTLISPRTMIQGHDGSLTLAYGDYRDNLILELEKRIYNNIKVVYDPKLFDIHDVVPAYNRKNDYSLQEFNSALAPSFYKWSANIGRDFSKPLSFNRSNPLTFNYRGQTAPDGREVPGYWRAIYRWILDTDRPNLCPWEMLGLSEKPSWWEDTYGPAPYTSENKVLWKDLSEGLLKPKGTPGLRLDKFVRPYLLNNIPVDGSGNIIGPIESGLANGIITESVSNDFIFGDVSPVEAAWRRSSYYSFSVLIAFMLLKPAQAFGLLLDRSRVIRNVAGQIIYKDTGRRIKPKDVVLPSIYTSKDIVQTSGIINYLIDYIVSDNLKSYARYQYDLKNITAKLSHRLGSFTSKEKFNLLLDSKSPTSQGSVFVPQDDYDIILNSSSPLKKIVYSGIIITRLVDGFEVKGYSKTQPYFKYYQWIENGSAINVGGISETFVTWTPNSQYAAGKIVQFNSKFYASKALHTTTTEFNPIYYEALAALPIIGGRDAYLRKTWDRANEIIVPYGTKFISIQEVVDFILGYGEWLKDQGFIFDDFNSNISAVTNWETSAKEFLFWTTQNWSTGQDKWDEWTPQQFVAIGSIVRYNGDYYRALMGIQPSSFFDEEKYVKLEGLSTVGSSVLGLSPSANKIVFSSNNAIVDDIRNPFNGYEIFNVDGNPIPVNFVNSYREDNSVTYIPSSDDGIYGATFYLIQKEQVVVFENTTMFNDTIYAPTSGYRQERIKVSGYVSSEWDGSFNVPGFIFDQAKIQDWETWKDYSLGDIVKYKEYYYTAKTFLPGTPEFVLTDWIKLDSNPTPALLPNWSYKATQFTDFYSLDSDNFDPSQQSVAQHLIGYQKRQYLSNIIQDDVSEYKFYQGMINEKGTQNVLNKLFDVLSSDDKESIEFYEEWALRVGQYGASSAFETIEFELDEAKFKNNPQGFELVDFIDDDKVDFIYRQTPNDVYLKPIGYDNNPWPVHKKFNPFLRTAGHVRPDEVRLVVKTLDEVLLYKPSLFNERDYIWVGFEGKTWNVYGITRTGDTVTNLTYSTSKKELTITTQDLPEIKAGDIVSVVTFEKDSKVDGFYRVKSVSLNEIVVSAVIDDFPATPFSDKNSTVLSVLRSRKSESIDDLDIVTRGVVNKGDRVWTNDAGNGSWGSWQYNNGYARGELTNTDPQDYGRFGRTVTLNEQANIALVSNNLADTVVYDRAGYASPWIQRQIIESPFVSDETKGNLVGEGVVISPDSRWLVLQTPTATNARELLALNTVVADNDVEAVVILQALGNQLGRNHGIRENVVYAKRTSTPDLYQLRKYTRVGTTSNFQWQNLIQVTITAPPLSCYEQVNGVYTGKLKYVASTNPDYSNDLRLLLDSNDVNLLVLATGWVPKVVIDLLGLTFVTPISDGIYPTIDSTGKITSFPRLAHLRVLAGQVLTVLATTPKYATTIVARVVEIFTSLGLIPSGSTLEQILTIVTNTITLNQPPFWDTDEITISPTAVFDDDYPEGKLVVEFNYYRAKKFAPQGTPITDKNYWKPLPYFPVEESGWGSTLPNHGVISIYEKDSNNIFTLVDTIISPFPATDEFYGSTVAFGENTLLIGAEGAGQSTGRLYQMNYGEFLYATALYNPQGSSGKTIKVSSTLGIEPGYFVKGIGFTNQKVVTIVDSTTLILDRAPDKIPLGNLDFYVNTWQFVKGPGLSRQKLVADQLRVGSKFSTSLAVSKDDSYLVVSAPGTTTNGKVIIFKRRSIERDYIFSQVINGDNIRFGEGLTISNSGEYLAISSVLYDGEKIDQGKVDIYKNINNTFTKVTSLKNNKPETAQLFGNKLGFMNDYQTLVVYSVNADTAVLDTFDDDSTIFDSNSTRILAPFKDSGRVDIYDRYGSKWVFSESLENISGSVSGYGSGVAVGSDVVLVTAPFAKVETGVDSRIAGKVFEYRKRAGTFGWNIVHKQVPRPDVSKIRKAFLYNKKLNKLISYIDILDPAQGKIPGIADQEIKYKTFYDPAIYSSGTSLVNVDEGMAWTKSQVGMLWWDLRSAKFFDNYDEEIVYRNSLGSTLFPGASIDIYEWVESKLTPADWNAQADTEEGISKGISGVTLYGNNVYSIVKKYDSVSQSFKNTYYFWVKNKKTVPNVLFRKLSAQDVSNLIANPRGMGYKYLELTGPNSFSLVNVKNLLNDKDTVLSVDYWTISNTERNVHSQWSLISNNKNSIIPKNIEQKWFDSLCGKDETGRVVPDTSLPIKLRYGIESKPRQGMFINRFEALKQIIEQANRVMSLVQIVDKSSLTILNSYEEEPSVISGFYDSVFDTDSELRFANIATFTLPIVTPIITDGRITGVNVLESGFGYVNAPYIEVSGTGQGAVLKSVIDFRGKIIGATIIESGEGYTDDTVLTIRNYCALVHSDSKSQGRWSIYSYDGLTQIWSRVKTQSYDTRKFWKKVDWYGTYTDPITGIVENYTPSTAINYAVETFNDLITISPLVGQIVKVRSTSTGDWLLLRKYQESTSIDWTQTYAIVGRQNGTVEISSSIYSFVDTIYGYDGSLYDGGIFDNVASTEIRKILISLRDEIFIDDLRTEYLNLFFASLRYAFVEQGLVDWAFKTSLIKAQHNVGMLDQPATYKNDNLPDFEAYISEVKPYRTKIREYVSSYTGMDTGMLSTTDFDLPPTLGEPGNSVTAVLVDNKIEFYNAIVDQYPWKHWYDNQGFEVTSLRIINSGTKYRTPPIVRFISDTGSGAEARAFVANGKLIKVVLLKKGKGYVTPPKVMIDGGILAGGTPAKVIATIGNGKTRSSLIKVKFDRINYNYFLTDLKKTEVFSGETVVSGSRNQFPLIWAPDVRLDSSIVSSVTIDGALVLRSSYTLNVVESSNRGYTSYSGSITFKSTPKKGSKIVVTYNKDTSVLSAADRIQYYYNPSSGELGKDLSQLMTGIDYGGVNVTGLDFNVGAGWGSVPYFTDKWDSFDPQFDDYVITVAANTKQFRLPYVPENGVNINIYHNKIYQETYVSDGVLKEYNYNSLVQYPPTVSTSRTVPIVGITTAYVSTPVFINRSAEGFTKQTTLTVQSISGLIEGMVVKGLNVSDGTFIKTITTINPTSHTITLTRSLINDVTQVTFGGNIIRVSSTVGIESGMLVVGSGFTNRQTVTKVVDSQYLILNVEPNTTPTGNLYFTKNYKGKDIIRVTSTFGMNVDDVLSLNPIPTTTILGYNCKIKSIVSSTDIQIDQILFDDIPNGYNIETSRGLIVPTDLSIEKTGVVRLKQPLPLGNRINIRALQSPVRIDDPYFDLYDGITVQPNGKKLAPENTVMSTIIGDGNNYGPLDPLNNDALPITIPFDYLVSAGDVFIFRKSTSDGSIAPQDLDYDTALSGGDLTYSTAKGLAADDIIVDGDGLITPTTSPAPEEVVPGQIVDTLSIKVYDRPSSGNAKFLVQNYLCDGNQIGFNIGQIPNSKQAVIVKTIEGITDPDSGEFIIVPKILQSGVDYTIDYSNSLITFDDPPAEGTRVSIFSLGFAGSNILDLDYYIGDGVTLEFITKAPWIGDLFTVLVYVDGVKTTEKTPVFFKTDETYQETNRIGMKFSVPPPDGSLINFIVVSGVNQTFPIVHEQVLIPNGEQEYELDYEVGVNLPAESNMIVRVDQKILPAPVNTYYTIKSNQYSYNIDPLKFAPYSIESGDISVIADNTVLKIGRDYTVDLGGITVKIRKSVYSQYTGKSLILSVVKDQSYTYVPASGSNKPKLITRETYNTTPGVDFTEAEKIYVTSFYNHNVLDVRRTEFSVAQSSNLDPADVNYYQYTALISGNIVLDRQVISDYYVWIVKNGVLLTPSIDYKLNDDKRSITLAITPEPQDKFTVITFGSNIITSGISYQQFKDMLNRVHFKRLSSNKITTLVNPLLINDTTILVNDASNFDVPNPQLNKPGIIEIRGERIEYFTKNGNQLSQLRRGTLGTGAPPIHKAGSYVQDIGSSSTVPYSEDTLVSTLISDATGLLALDFAPTKTTEKAVDLAIGRTYTIVDLGTTDWNYVANTPKDSKGNYTVTYSVGSTLVAAKQGTGTGIAIGATFGKTDEIEVFVGGFDDSTVWEPKTDYLPGTILKVASYTYKVIAFHRSGSTFESPVSLLSKVNGETVITQSNVNYREAYSFFVGNIRLNKNPYKVHDVSLHSESPEGDVLLPPDFSVYGAQLKLTNPLAFGTRVTVVRKQGVAWDSETSIMNEDTKIARFLKAEPGIWYNTIDKYETAVGINATFDSIRLRIDNDIIRLNQG